MSEYPEHDKLQKVQKKSKAIEEFLDWLETNNLCLGEWISDYSLVPSNVSTVILLAKYFGIDLMVIEEEKRHMIDLQIRLNKES